MSALFIESSGLYVGGKFGRAIQPGGEVLAVRNVALWTGTQWEALGEGLRGFSDDFAVGPDGLLYALASDEEFSRWDGIAWEAVPFGPAFTPNLLPRALLAADNRLYVGSTGQLIPEGMNPNNYLFWHDPTTSAWGEAWGVLGSDHTDGTTDDVLALATGPDGTAWAGGNFRFAGTERVDHVAAWDGSAWSPMGRGVRGSFPQVRALLDDGAGGVYVGGPFGEVVQADGTAVNSKGVARWDGSQWQPVGRGVDGNVRALAAALGGGVYVAGGFTEARQADGSALPAESLARWDPDTARWEVVPPGHGVRFIEALAVDAAGALYVGGNYIIDGSGESRARVARLDPLTDEWTTLREWTFTEVTALVAAGDPTAGGALFAGLPFDGVWGWDGSTWTDLSGPSSVRALALNGDPSSGGLLYAGGSEALEQWDGQTWRTVEGSPPIVYAFALDEAETAGDVALWVGGEFASAGGEAASCVARWETDDLGGGTAAVAITLDVASEPVIIAPEGGSFPFRVTLVNTTDEVQTVEAWSEATFPDGSVKQPNGQNDLLGPVTVTLAPGDTLTRRLIQQVPGGIPAGDYVYAGLVGTFPDGVMDSSSVAGRKLPGRKLAHGARLAAAKSTWRVTDAATGVPVVAGEHWTTQPAATALPAPSSVPASLVLEAHPNPFRDAATLTLGIPETAEVRVAVYDVLGRSVAVLLDGEVEAGQHTVRLDGHGLPSGVYFVQAKIGREVLTQEVTLLR